MALTRDDWEFGSGCREITRAQVHRGVIRRCSTLGCDTILSQYNDTGFCSLCRTKRQDSLPTKSVRQIYQQRYRAEQREKKKAAREAAAKLAGTPNKPPRLPEGSWSPFFEKCQECGETGHPHHACGFCRLCYLRRYHGTTKRRERKHAWSMEHPHCLTCSTTEKPHRARGLCAMCYEVFRRSVSRSARSTTG